MHRDRIREVLGAFRAGGQDASDPIFAEAQARTHDDPDLARWFTQEQAFDRAVAQALNRLPVPAGLKAGIIAKIPKKDCSR